jgi:hypothetical protein
MNLAWARWSIGVEGGTRVAPPIAPASPIPDEEQVMASLFTRVASKSRPRRSESLEKRRRTSLSVEALEDRLVPTIIFNPAFGPETVTSSNPPAGSIDSALRTPTIVPVFWGQYWSTPSGQQDIGTIRTAIQSIISGPYLSGLVQYGSDGHAVLNSSSGLISSEPFTGAGNLMSSYLQNVIDTSWWTIPQPTGGSDYQPIFITITDPNSPTLLPGALGYNTVGLYTHYADAYHDVNDPYNTYSQMHEVWVSTSFQGGRINLDNFTNVFSHELVETISDPYLVGIHLSLPSSLPSGLQGGGPAQIGDGEAAGLNYGYRLGGYKVQPYWSVANNAFIVPDGNRQNFVLTPLWNNNSFTGAYDLSVKGDQLGANYNDSITIQGANASTSIRMNGETATFDSAVLKSIYVDTRGGSNVVTVQSLSGLAFNVPGRPAGLTLNITSTAPGSFDSVVIGNNGSLTGIVNNPTINVSNASGQTMLGIYANQNGPGNVYVYSNSVTVDGVTVNYTPGAYGPDGNVHQVTSLFVEDGYGANFVDIQSVGALTNTYVFGTASDFFYNPYGNRVFFYVTH